MREITPYRTKTGMQNAIDNGGRFYHWFTEANDQTVTRSELAKAAGSFSVGLKAFLFLDMACQDLDLDDQDSIIGLLEPGLKKQYRKDRPKAMRPSQVESQGTAGRSVIVEGYPRFLEDRTQFNGFIMIPIMAGKVMTFTMIPMYDKFDVYEVFDDERMRKPKSMVATVKGQRFSHSGPIRFGGILRKLKFEDKTKTPHKFYLETVFYSKL